jgi:phosphoserine aminotransferase
MTYNFNAGPATIPATVMERARGEFIDYANCGYGIIEASHRSAEFEEIIARAEGNVRELTGIGDDFAVLFLQGGASTQFAMIPMNFLPPDRTAAYVDTGLWSGKAVKEARKIGHVAVVAGTADADYDHIPELPAGTVATDAAYLHITTNNTICGTQYQAVPEVPDCVPLFADMSSDILSRPLPFESFDQVYARAHKNLGPSGVTLVIVCRDLAESGAANLPSMLDYRTHIKGDSLYNTPPTFAIYMMALVTDWICEQGGLSAVAEVNRRKAADIYGCIDHDGFYRGRARTDSRSAMNVCFNLPTAAQEAAFVEAAAASGLIGLKGHRSVGGIRASIYNGMPPAGVNALVDFMQEFRRSQG